MNMNMNMNLNMVLGVQRALAARRHQRLPRRLAPILPLVLLSFLLAACTTGDPLAVFRPTPATAHERYGQALMDAGLDSTALGREWLAASDSALRAPLAAPVPTRELGVYVRSEARAVAWRVSLRDGQELQTILRTEGPSARVYLDLFEITTDSARPFVHRATADSTVQVDSTGTLVRLAYEARRDADFIVRLQPELLRAGRFELTLQTEPVLAFPVMNSGNRNIQSYFGADREGGRRVHHGIDIFAARGTPALAATDGVVRSISPNNLGGNVVWLSDQARGQSLYYAHLDSQAVVAGQVVRRGDTLGFVGNTGNARTTAPHLHFGIYRRGQGPVDPLLHVRRTTVEVPEVRADTMRLGERGVATGSGLALREGPSAADSAIRDLAATTELSIMAATARWFRVQLDDGTAGYLAATSVRPLAAARQ